MPGRIIAIGDIHGCHEEFATLLDILAPAKTDTRIRPLICLQSLAGKCAMGARRFAMGAQASRLLFP